MSLLVYVHMYVRASMCAQIHMCHCVCTQVHNMCVSVHTLVYMCVCVCQYTCVSVCTQVPMCIFSQQQSNQAAAKERCQVVNLVQKPVHCPSPGCLQGRTRPSVMCYSGAVLTW